jgi:hypothetical protein
MSLIPYITLVEHNPSRLSIGSLNPTVEFKIKTGFILQTMLTAVTLNIHLQFFPG